MGPLSVVPDSGVLPEIFEIIFCYNLVLAHFPGDMGDSSPAPRPLIGKEETERRSGAFQYWPPTIASHSAFPCIFPVMPLFYLRHHFPGIPALVSRSGDPPRKFFENLL